MGVFQSVGNFVSYWIDGVRILWQGLCADFNDVQRACLFVASVLCMILSRRLPIGRHRLRRLALRLRPYVVATLDDGTPLTSTPSSVRSTRQTLRQIQAAQGGCRKVGRVRLMAARKSKHRIIYNPIGKGDCLFASLAFLVPGRLSSRRVRVMLQQHSKLLMASRKLLLGLSLSDHLRAHGICEDDFVRRLVGRHARWGNTFDVLVASDLWDMRFRLIGLEAGNEPELLDTHDSGKLHTIAYARHHFFVVQPRFGTPRSSSSPSVVHGGSMSSSQVLRRAPQSFSDEVCIPISTFNRHRDGSQAATWLSSWSPFRSDQGLSQASAWLSSWSLFRLDQGLSHVCCPLQSSCTPLVQGGAFSVRSAAAPTSTGTAGGPVFSAVSVVDDGVSTSSCALVVNYGPGVVPPPPGSASYAGALSASAERAHDFGLAVACNSVWDYTLDTVTIGSTVQQTLDSALDHGYGPISAHTSNVGRGCSSLVNTLYCEVFDSDIDDCYTPDSLGTSRNVSFDTLDQVSCCSGNSAADYWERESLCAADTAPLFETHALPVPSGPPRVLSPFVQGGGSGSCFVVTQNTILLSSWLPRRKDQQAAHICCLQVGKLHQATSLLSSQLLLRTDQEHGCAGFARVVAPSVLTPSQAVPLGDRSSTL
eukprot:2523043-Amphidinium_carterae.1